MLALLSRSRPSAYRKKNILTAYTKNLSAGSSTCAIPPRSSENSCNVPPAIPAARRPTTKRDARTEMAPCSSGIYYTMIVAMEARDACTDATHDGVNQILCMESLDDDKTWRDDMMLVMQPTKNEFQRSRIHPFHSPTHRLPRTRSQGQHHEEEEEAQSRVTHHQHNNT